MWIRSLLQELIHAISSCDTRRVWNRTFVPPFWIRGRYRLPFTEWVSIWCGYEMMMGVVDLTATQQYLYGWARVGKRGQQTNAHVILEMRGTDGVTDNQPTVVPSHQALVDDSSHLITSQCLHDRLSIMQLFSKLQTIPRNRSRRSVCWRDGRVHCWEFESVWVVDLISAWQLANNGKLSKRCGLREVTETHVALVSSQTSCYTYHLASTLIHITNLLEHSRHEMTIQNLPLINIVDAIVMFDNTIT